MVFFTDFMEKLGLNIQIAAESNIGLHRSDNEDSFLICRPDAESALACVADGIGSHTDGKLASSICCRDLLEWASDGKHFTDDPEDFLKDFFTRTNEKIFERNYRESRLRPMGCTAVAACFTRRLITILNVGDSRFYEYLPGRDEPLKQITIDHHPDDEILEKLSEVYNVKKDNLKHRVLLHSLGTRYEFMPDIFTVIPDPDAIYLLCSDGLSGHVPEERIAAVLSDRTLSARKLTSALVREALLCGGRDNVTVITAKYTGEENGIA